MDDENKKHLHTSYEEFVQKLEEPMDKQEKKYTYDEFIQVLLDDGTIGPKETIDHFLSPPAKFDKTVKFLYEDIYMITSLILIELYNQKFDNMRKEEKGTQKFNNLREEWKEFPKKSENLLKKINQKFNNLGEEQINSTPLTYLLKHGR